VANSLLLPKNQPGGVFLAGDIVPGMRCRCALMAQRSPSPGFLRTPQPAGSTYAMATTFQAAALAGLPVRDTTVWSTSSRR
jgi:hypothetical protein